mmetsp:Transcript_78487/g.188208  ORF Transcript_78487/g.188208 Transcript_78487/m.188208 type:complete len:282 (-) Transcript_78487:121-966(-)|eukprot:CAMPEP_0181472892 /NCGR_PEP_ID=MMETSP1110-20121109/39839_1 /TAXON_ID=174948 /ORGANISM="Symbiodinium sp., Strain CCMP421" /LENGTH=281 /DNA_ID=CAMNT_0023597985 /DNA_START=67 /DNA_END=912 /DNA_ORIENTATION=+
MSGWSGWSSIDPGLYILKRFCTEQVETIMERQPLLQARGEAVRRELSPGVAFLVLSTVVTSAYTFIYVYFWVCGAFVLASALHEGDHCSPELLAWLAAALLQPLFHGLVSVSVPEAMCSQCMSWLYSLGLVLTGCGWLLQSQGLPCHSKSPTFFIFIEAYLDFMVITWMLMLATPVVAFGVLNLGTRLGVLRIRSSELDLRTLEAVDFKKEIFCEDANASEGQLPAECCVCCEHFSADKVIRRTPCKHVFHEACLARWLQVNDSCPVCRVSLQAALDPEAK